MTPFCKTLLQLKPLFDGKLLIVRRLSLCSKNYDSPTCVTRCKVTPNKADPTSMKHLVSSLKFCISEFFCTHVTRMIVVIFCTVIFASTPGFYQVELKFITKIPPQFGVFSAKSPSINQRSVKNAYKKEQTLHVFLGEP